MQNYDPAAQSICVLTQDVKNSIHRILTIALDIDW